MRLSGEELEKRAKKIKLLALDVDGVMTDGTVVIAGDGTVGKRFNIRDGHAMIFLPKNGIELAIVSGRMDAATQARAMDLKIVHVLQGVRKKLGATRELASKLSIGLDEIAYMGDDINDVPVIEAVGIGAAPADASAEAIAASHWTSAHRGGEGAVRELCELLLRARGQWQGVLDAMR
jgi:3-deoxy-D-manno-octulosonate 8-phosphate phosphatase (KDO 8-P phosphatase)